jgi:hypothetical protein
LASAEGKDPVNTIVDRVYYVNHLMHVPPVRAAFICALTNNLRYLMAIHSRFNRKATAAKVP